MNIEIRTFIDQQAARRIQKHQHRVYQRVVWCRRRENQTGVALEAPTGTALPWWTFDQQFNPYYVRHKSSSLSHAIEKAIKNHSYRPRPALRMRIRKRGGGRRSVSIYTVPDAGVGVWLFKQLQARNDAIFSKFAFGFGLDRNGNDAIRHIARAVAATPRLYVVKYDSKNFFDSVDHAYLLEVLNGKFDVEEEELSVISSFLSGGSAYASDYEQGLFTPRKVGIPQGSAISLFLANVAFHELDKDLERLDVTYARYGDDVVVLAQSYSQAHMAANLILQWSAKSKVKVNHEKSDGISLLMRDGAGEIKTKRSIIFLGAEISSSGICPPEKRISRIKREIARVVYRHLIQAPKKGTFNVQRIQPDVDWDWVTCINEIRRMIYGRVSEADLTQGLQSKCPRKAMGFSSMNGLEMVDMPERFKELDGWLVGLLERTYALRASLVTKLGAKPLQLTRRLIRSGEWYKCDRLPQETRLPSSYRAWLYMRMFARSRSNRRLIASTWVY